MSNDYRPQWKILHSYFNPKTLELYDDEMCDFYESMKRLYRQHLKQSYSRYSMYQLENLFFGKSFIRPFFSNQLDKEEILSRVDWSSLILKHLNNPTPIHGTERYKALCPFHNEKTPSFNIDFEKKVWYCHGCVTGGDFFSFLMKAHECTFLEALRLADSHR